MIKEEQLEQKIKNYVLSLFEGIEETPTKEEKEWLGSCLYLFTEPREKQIQIDAEQIRALQKQNGELTDKVKELEAQIEKMKSALIDIKSNTDDVNIEWQIKYLFDELEIKENAD